MNLNAFVLISAVLLLTVTQTVNAFTSADNQAKEEIISSLSKSVNNQYSQYKTIIAQTHNNSTIVIYNQSQAPGPQPPQCPSGTFYNETSKTCQPNPPQPPTCPAGQHWNATAGQCQDDVIIPPPQPPTTEKPAKTFNTSTIMRVAAIADIDNNAGLVTQLNLMKSYHVQQLIVMGDYGYSSCQGVIDKLKAAGFTSANTVMVQGNHDCAATTKAFNGWSELYGHKIFGQMEIFSIDANQNFDCSSTQFKSMKDELVSSELKYKVAAVHQPFLTVKSTHGANGQFGCYDPIFRAEGLSLVLEGHNHNYQRFDANGITYLLAGTGTHDTGSSMYPLNSNTASGFQCLKCITGTNGFALMDFALVNKGMQGWFLSNSDALKDSFN